jgi:outer membrane protein, multidrug efflux system
VLLTAAAIAACSPTAEPQGIWAKLWSLEVGPDYQRPPVNPPENFRSQIGPSEAASLADQAWWKVFRDKPLQEMIVTALTHNYDLQLAAARVEQARALVGVAISPIFPQIGYQGFAGREKTFYPLGEDAGNLTFNAFGGLFDVVWEIDVWGRIRRST